MKTFKLAVLAAVPLIVGSVAFAQQPPAGAHNGRPEMSAADHAAMHSHMCSDQYARAAGRLAYLEAKLSLTDQQKPAFAKFRQAALDGADKARAACLEETPKGDARPTILEREARMEKMLSVRLEAMKATRPALQALYDALTPAQRETLDRMGPHGHGHRMGMGGGRGMMGPGMMEHDGGEPH